MLMSIDGEFYSPKHFVKFVKDKDVYTGTTIVPIRLGKNKKDTYMQKKFKNIQLPEYFKKIDENLYVNFNHIVMVKVFNYYSYLTSNTKKKIIGNKYVNYNIKVTGKNEKIKKILEEEKMWIKVQNNYINLKNVTNIYFDTDKIFINFKNSATNLNNVEDIRPEYILIYDDGVSNLLKEKLEELNWLKIGDKYINLDNVFNIKMLNTDNKIIVFLNFISNISKVVNGEKIISTEFAKVEFDDKEEALKFIKELQKRI